MAKFYLIVIIALLGYIFLLENRAVYCGSGWYSPELPFGVKPDWFDGIIWLVDSDGFGLITPAICQAPSESDKFKTSNWNEVTVNKILAYSYGTAVYVKVETSHPLVQYAVIDQPNPTRDKIKLFSKNEFVQYLNNSTNDLIWIPVDVKDCRTINFQRFIAYLGVLILSLYFVQTIRKNSKKKAVG